jgi:hypothetical protein
VIFYAFSSLNCPKYRFRGIKFAVGRTEKPPKRYGAYPRRTSSRRFLIGFPYYCLTLIEARIPMAAEKSFKELLLEKLPNVVGLVVFIVGALFFVLAAVHKFSYANYKHR